MNRLLKNKLVDRLHITFNQSEQNYIKKNAKSSDLKNRKKCFDYIDCGLGVNKNCNFIFEVLDILAPDKNNNLRWKAFLYVNGFIEEKPKKTWLFILKYASHRLADIRSATACNLLEHQLEYHFKEYFPKVEKIVLSGDKKFIDTFLHSWNFVKGKKNIIKIKRLIKKAEELRK